MESLKWEFLAHKKSEIDSVLEVIELALKHRVARAMPAVSFSISELISSSRKHKCYHLTLRKGAEGEKVRKRGGMKDITDHEDVHYVINAVSVSRNLVLKFMNLYCQTFSNRKVSKPPSD